jgi:hypothetical protein
MKTESGYYSRECNQASICTGFKFNILSSIYRLKTKKAACLLSEWKLGVEEETKVYRPNVQAMHL